MFVRLGVEHVSKGFSEKVGVEVYQIKNTYLLIQQPGASFSLELRLNTYLLYLILYSPASY